MAGDIHIERDLFLQIAGGNETAFRKIFHIYNAKLFPAMLSLTKSEAEAEEIVQDVFLKLWLNRASLPEIENPGGWLYRIASNLALSSLRTKARNIKHSSVLQEGQTEADDSLELKLDASELNKLVAEAVEKLPSGRRQVFILSRVEGLNRKQISERMGLSESTVKNQLTSALKFIQAYIIKKRGVYLPVILFLPFY